MINYNIDPVEVGLRPNFTQSHGSVLESGNYYKPTDAVSIQYGWVKPSAIQPPIVVPKHMTSVPGKELAMTPVIPGVPINQEILQYSSNVVSAPGPARMTVIERIRFMLKEIWEWLLHTLGISRKKDTAVATTEAAAVYSADAGDPTYAPHYQTSISNMPFQLTGHTSIFSRTIL